MSKINLEKQLFKWIIYIHTLTCKCISCSAWYELNYWLRQSFLKIITDSSRFIAKLKACYHYNKSVQGMLYRRTIQSLFPGLITHIPIISPISHWPCTLAAWWVCIFKTAVGINMQLEGKTNKQIMVEYFLCQHSWDAKKLTFLTACIRAHFGF